MFITVKHGDQQEALFNTDCSVVMLLESVRRRCRPPDHLGVAMVDESLSVQQLPEGSVENAGSLFTERAVYILLAVKKHDGGQVRYTALLDDADAELLRHLDSLANPSGRGGAKGRTPGALKKAPTKALLTPSSSHRKRGSNSKLKGKG